MRTKSKIYSFLGQWIAKKSRKPFCSGSQPPAIFVSNITFDKGHNFHTIRIGRKKGLRIQNDSETEHIEVIQQEEARTLRKIYRESGILSETEQTQTSHTRENGEKKRDFTKSNFQAALYDLKRMFPDFDCFAYICAECGAVHLGKKEKVKSIQESSLSC